LSYGLKASEAVQVWHTVVAENQLEHWVLTVGTLSIRFETVFHDLDGVETVRSVSRSDVELFDKLTGSLNVQVIIIDNQDLALRILINHFLVFVIR